MKKNDHLLLLEELKKISDSFPEGSKERKTLEKAGLAVVFCYAKATEEEFEIYMNQRKLTKEEKAELRQRLMMYGGQETKGT